MAGVKQFFRYLRGEINGFYLNKVAYVVNKWCEEKIYKDLIYMRNVQFEVGSMTTEDIFNIAKFIGITQLLVKGELVNNVIHLTGSEKVDGQEYSERGLWVKDKEIFDFVRTTQEEYASDIVVEATPERQTVLIPSGYQNPAGKQYIWFGDEVYDEFGNFVPERLRDSPPPDDRPYTEYYGPQFLQLAENLIVFRVIPAEALYQVVISTQKLRYQGSSTQLFAEITNAIVGDGVPGESGFVKLTVQETVGNHIIWTYENDEQAPARDKVLRMLIWKRLVESFFPQIVLREVIPYIVTKE